MKYFDQFFQPAGWEEKTFTAADGKKIRYGHAEPAGDKKGTVLITTGYADYIESYYETIHDYMQRGYAVWIMDWAGQGGSDKKRTAADKAMSIEDHVRHFHQFRHQVVEIDAQSKAEKKPVILSTHSMGGQIGLNYLHFYPNDIDMAIMAAPLVDFGLRGAARATLRAIFKSAMGLGMANQSLKGGREGVQRQSTAGRKKLREGEPVRIDLHRTFMLMNRQLGAEDPTVTFIDSLFESTARMNEEVVLRNIKTPILFAVAGRDHVVNNEAIKRAAGFVPDAKLVEIAGATHGLWLEKDEYLKEWWGHIDGFLAAQHARLDAARKPPASNNNNPPKGPR